MRAAGGLRFDGGELYKIRVPLMEDGADSAPLSARCGQERATSGEGQ